MSLLGIDVGTSGCKATVLDETGSVLGQSYQDYSLHSPQPGWQEIDPDLVWLSVKKVIRIAVADTEHDPVQAISVSSFGESVVAVDSKGNSLGNSMLYIDSRGQEESEYLKLKIGNARVLAITGTNIQPMYSLCKIMWMKKHQPERYRNTWKFLLFADYILFRMGGKPKTDYTLATRTMAFDIIRKKWSAEILDAAEIDQNKFGDPVQSGSLVGELSTDVAEAIGIPSGVSLVAGGHDQPCAALGSGVIKPGLAVDGLGTTECITPTFSQPIMSSNLADKHFACVPHVVKDLFVTYAFTFTCGSVVKWYYDMYGKEFKQAENSTGINSFNQMIDHALNNPEPSPVFVLPHFAGAATPYMNHDAKGAIVGLTIGTSSDDILKAVLEGVTYEIMVNMEYLAQNDIRADELRVVGGLAKSESFLQLKANIMGKKLTTLQCSEAGTIGVAILSGTAIGMFRTINHAVEKLVKIKKTYYPDPILHAMYNERFRIYKNIYPAICQIELK